MIRNIEKSSTKLLLLKQNPIFHSNYLLSQEILKNLVQNCFKPLQISHIRPSFPNHPRILKINSLSHSRLLLQSW